MFPLNWNIPFIRKNGSRTTLGNIIENASSELPPHSAGDAGKLLGVKADGSVEWSNTVNSEIQTLTNDINDLSGFNSTHYGLTFQTVSVDLTNVATLNDLGKAIISAFNTFLSSLSNKQSCKIVNIAFEGWWRYLHSNRDEIFTNNSVFSTENLTTIGSTNSGIDIIAWYLANTSRIIRTAIATNGTVTVSNITTDNISVYSISNVYIKCEIYTYL